MRTAASTLLTRTRAMCFTGVPGVTGGWLSEQLAHHLLSRVDRLIDWHSGDDRPTVDYIRKG